MRLEVHPGRAGDAGLALGAELPDDRGIDARLVIPGEFLPNPRPAGRTEFLAPLRAAQQGIDGPGVRADVTRFREHGGAAGQGTRLE